MKNLTKHSGGKNINNSGIEIWQWNRLSRQVVDFPLDVFELRLDQHLLRMIYFGFLHSTGLDGILEPFQPYNSGILHWFYNQLASIAFVWSRVALQFSCFKKINNCNADEFSLKYSHFHSFFCISIATFQLDNNLCLFVECFIIFFFDDFTRKHSNWINRHRDESIMNIFLGLMKKLKCLSPVSRGGGSEELKEYNKHKVTWII